MKAPEGGHRRLPTLARPLRKGKGPKGRNPKTTTLSHMCQVVLLNVGGLTEEGRSAFLQRGGPQVFQKEGKNKTKIANNSNLPKIIPIDKIHLEISGKDEKSPLGPIIGPKPGPTLEIEVAAPDIEVIKSSPVNDSNAVKTKNITK